MNINHKSFDDIFLVVHGAFLGWITDAMHAAFIAISNENRLELVILLNTSPTRLDLKIIEEEILTEIRNNVLIYNVCEVDYSFFVLEGSIGLFKEKGGMWINQYWPVFQKYDYMPYDED